MGNQVFLSTTAEAYADLRTLVCGWDTKICSMNGHEIPPGINECGSVCGVLRQNRRIENFPINDYLACCTYIFDLRTPDT